MCSNLRMVLREEREGRGAGEGEEGLQAVFVVFYFFNNNNYGGLETSMTLVTFVNPSGGMVEVGSLGTFLFLDSFLINTEERFARNVYSSGKCICHLWLIKTFD